VGGQSRRMGSDKALLEVGGDPLVARVAGVLSQVCGDVRLVGDPARYGHLGLVVTADEFPGQGPVAGIETALRVTETTWNLVVACDMPALNASILEELFAADVDCAVPRYPDGRIEPLCVVYHRRCHAVLRKALESGVRRVKDVFDQIEANLALRYVAVSCPEPFTNLNTPEDLRRYRNG
jgi:molybdenum cofactor guanylyltransferase